MWGRPEDLLHANSLILSSLPATYLERLGAVDKSASIAGRVRLGPGSVVDDVVEIEGPVVVGAGAHLQNGTRVGPETSLGDGVLLNSVHIQRSIVLDRAHIEGSLRITDSLIGRDVDNHARTAVKPDLTLILGDAAKIQI
jgi:glucose-1-phosphate thymidylyltransferase